MAMNRYSVYPSSVVYAGPTTLNIDQILNHSVNLNNRDQEVIPGGAVDRSAVLLAYAEPMINLTTGDLKKVLDTITITAGLALTGGGTIRYQRRSDGGTFASSTSHVTLTFTKGFAHPTRIQATQDDEGGATVDLAIVPLSSDGLTEPIADNISVDYAAAPAPAFNQVYHLGPVYHNGTEIEGVRGVTIETGIEYSPFRADGDVFATVGSIISRRPRFVINGVNLDVVNTIATQFKAALAGTFAAYFWKGAASSTRVAAGTAGHCKISAAAGAWNSDNFTVADRNDGTFDIVVMPTGTLAFSSASAIP